MDSTSKQSTSDSLESISTINATPLVESLMVTYLWAVENVLSGPAFYTFEFLSYLQHHGIDA